MFPLLNYRIGPTSEPAPRLLHDFLSLIGACRGVLRVYAHDAGEPTVTTRLRGHQRRGLADGTVALVNPAYPAWRG